MMAWLAMAVLLFAALCLSVLRIPAHAHAALRVFGGGGAAQAAAMAAAQLGGAEERFAFGRAVSRLYEMQSPAYLEKSRARG